MSKEASRKINHYCKSKSSKHSTTEIPFTTINESRIDTDTEYFDDIESYGEHITSQCINLFKPKTVDKSLPINNIIGTLPPNIQYLPDILNSNSITMPIERLRQNLLTLKISIFFCCNSVYLFSSKILI